VWSLFFQKVVDSEKVMHGLKKSKRLTQAAKDKIETICIILHSLISLLDSGTPKGLINHGRFFRICQPPRGVQRSGGDGDRMVVPKNKDGLAFTFSSISGPKQIAKNRATP
jgi:hypothetical protein